jgi:uncharacterized cupredoxin-like copper-binding protein
MSTFPRIVGAPAVTIAFGLLLIAALADEPGPVRVQIKLWDKPNGQMGITLSSSQVKAGEVEFDVKNTSKDLPHQFLIMHAESAPPYDASAGQVVERKLHGLMGVEDLEPARRRPCSCT